MSAVLTAAGGLAAAAALYWGLTRHGGSELRGWAAPGAAAVACAGLGLAFHLPSWLTVALFLGALFLLNRRARERLAAEAAAVGKVPVADLGWELSPAAAPDGAVAAWAARDGTEAVLLTLDYAGEKEEDILSTVTTRCARFRPGILAAHRPGAPAAASGQAAGRDPVEGLPGQPPGVVLRCLPPDYAFAFCDLKTLSVLAELLELARPEREVWAQVNGPELTVVCGGLPSREEIGKLLACAAALAARQRHLGRLEAA